MLVSSLSHVPKVPCSVVICVDCRPTITKGCLGSLVPEGSEGHEPDYPGLDEGRG